MFLIGVDQFFKHCILIHPFASIVLEAELLDK